MIELRKLQQKQNAEKHSWAICARLLEKDAVKSHVRKAFVEAFNRGYALGLVVGQDYINKKAVKVVASNKIASAQIESIVNDIKRCYFVLDYKESLAGVLKIAIERGFLLGRAIAEEETSQSYIEKGQIVE